MSTVEMTVKDKIEFLFAVKNLKIGRKEKWAEGTDFVASDVIADDKVLVRTVDPRNKSGYVGADVVKDMLKTMRRKNCERGFIVADRFTGAAIDEMQLCNIQQFSDTYMPPVASENIVLTINDCISSLCRTKCGAAPLQENDCRAVSKDKQCRVKSISDDAMFHYERGWTDLLKNDLRQLLAMNKTPKA